ncbi:uncharacterized protein LOC118437787 isoform X1 [Folsomia candida]|nr:uncharacterized protein LOC118437787 isoform X1 [Folsomia candida]XP_035713051.1 uncharacterized protein LOC118437787 isoform X1 [Folsomia candida]
MDTIQDDKFLETITTYDLFLGEGGFGIVLRAIDDEKKQTAVKFLFPDAATDKEQNQIDRECYITKNLQKHSNIVQVLNVERKSFTPKDLEGMFPMDISIPEKLKALLYDKNRVLDSVCIQMKLCGENLRSWLRVKEAENVLTFERVWGQLNIIKNLIAGLKFLHQNQIMHRDLKPENVMFSKVNYTLPVKIGDFGLSRVLPPEGTQTGSLTSLVGTRSYMAPEIRNGGKDYTFQADLFSLGLIIWEVLEFVKHSYFDRLVNDQEESLLDKHAIMGNSFRGIIIELTKRRKEARAKDFVGLDKLSKAVEEVLTRPVLSAKNGHHFRIGLESAKQGTIIRLENGEYIGPFYIKSDNVRIFGNGQGTVIKCNVTGGICIDVSGNNCMVSNIFIKLNGENICQGILLSGTNNSVSNVHIDQLHSQNTLEYSKWFPIARGVTTLTERSQKGGNGISIKEGSDFNKLSSILCKNNSCGILICGSYNRISRVELIKDVTNLKMTGIYFSANATENCIKNCSASGYSTSCRDWGVEFDGYGRNCSVTDSQCGPIYLRWSTDTRLRNVDCGELIRIDGKNHGTKLEKCRGQLLISRRKNISIETCNFTNHELPATRARRVKKLPSNIEMNDAGIEPKNKEIEVIPAITPLCVHNSEELRASLESATVRLEIRLEVGEYTGSFHVKSDNVSIFGKDGGTVFKCESGETCIDVSGSYCQISNICILLSQRTSDGIKISGNNGVIKYVKIYCLEATKYNRQEGISITGSNISVEEVTMENMYRGIHIKSASKNNTISAIGFKNNQCGIVISGSNNSISNLKFVKEQFLFDDSNKYFTGIYFDRGSVHNVLTNCITEGYTHRNSDKGVDIWATKNCNISESQCGPIYLGWASDITLNNVDCKELIDIFKASVRVNLVNCRGQSLVSHTPRLIIDTCDFINQFVAPPKKRRTVNRANKRAITDGSVDGKKKRGEKE